MLVHKGGKIKNWGGECRDVTPTKSLSQNIRVDVNREVFFFFFFFFLIQFNVPFKIISLIETSQSVGGAKREYPGKTT